ncbi:uncharacterized protein N7473_005607 [Penicillium subrubescens]|uniref:uncharacterized protein n=1 Tax=Penicillium subrubescens TaxID=1316194 RepID=UPI002545A66D|nr:uncharacterized protein N7473_005607 [Penicillium subrubescens]KAJ5896208.1 hypothetical protein N7473_005607 [Penicillium subrubescens]
MDRLSVTASVTGLLSLSIQVTESLVDFYTAYKEQDTVVARTTENLENLLVVFRSLGIILRNRQFRNNERELVQKINKAIQRCNRIIEELQSECDRFRDISVSGFKGQIRTAKCRAAYPFRKGTLQNLREDIREIRGNLSIALNLLELNDHRTTLDEISELKSLLKQMNASHISSTIRGWLIAPDATINHNAAYTKRHTGTGLWFIKSEHFTNWLTQHNSFLWINSFAGCGKSILCSTAVQYTFREKQHKQGVGIAFFYFTFNNESKQDTSAILRALLLQLSGQFGDGDRDLKQLHDLHKSGTPSTQALIAYLERIVRRFHDVYILLDALDESPRGCRREGVLTIINEIRKYRDEPDVRESLNLRDDQRIIMKNSEINRDITNFITCQLNDDSSLRKWETYHKQIRKALAESAQGVFRYVEYQLNALKRCRLRTRKHLKKCLSLPRDLDKTYERILYGIDKNCVDDVRRILTMLCFSARPLTVAELIHSYAVDLDEPPHLDRDDRLLVDIHSLRDICLGLIKTTKDEDDKGQDILTVHLSHFSVQEYLQSDRIQHPKTAIFALSSGPSHAEIAQICLVYLMEPILSSTELDYAKVLEFPLAPFTAQHWYHHYTNYEKRVSKVESLLQRLFQHNTNTFVTWIRLHNIDRPWHGMRYYKDPIDDIGPPLYYASLLGLESVVGSMMEEDATDSALLETVNAQGGTCNNALQAACLKGHERVVQMLLDRGANANTQGGRFGNTLQAAYLNGSEIVVEMLLDRGAVINAQGGEYPNALRAAYSKGHERVVQMLLDRGANVNTQGERFGNALQAACLNSSEIVVEMLLDRGAVINAQGGEYPNALRAAYSKGHERVVQMLLDRGANVNTQGERFGNALQAACLNSSEIVVEILLDRGADINAQDGEYNALHDACLKGHERVVQMLLDRGANVNTQDGRFGNALQAACSNGSEIVVQMLLDRGADINAQDGEYTNALHNT